MDKLEQIKNTVTTNGMREWTDERVDQAMREYATEVARHNLEMASGQATAYLDVRGWPTPSRESITSLEIELI